MQNQKSFSTSTIGAALNAVMAGTFTKYKGCVISKTAAGFEALGKPYTTFDAAKAGIDNAFQSIKL